MAKRPTQTQKQSTSKTILQGLIPKIKPRQGVHPTKREAPATVYTRKEKHKGRDF